MATGELISCELLCYVMNKYGNSPSDTLKSVLLAFYSPNEIMASKEVLYKDSSAMNVDGLPRLVQRRKTDDKARHEVDDIFTLLEAMDERALLGALPKYVASDLSRLPPVNTGELDMTLLLLRVAALEGRMSHMVTECVEAAQATLLNRASNTADTFGATASEMRSSDSFDETLPKSVRVASDAISETAITSNESASAQYAVIARNNKPTLPRPTASPPAVVPKQTAHRFSGKCTTASTSTVKAVPRKLHAFVARLDKDTKEDDLVAWFDNVGITGIQCYKIKSPENRSFSTSAFKVSCDARFAELFYDEGNWPIGCDVRDWYVRQTGPTVQT